ncbi:Techylectin-5A, partial [Araneus ventricosus]
NDNIFALTNQKSYSVRFDLEQITRETAFAEYNYFWIDEEAQNYKLHIEDYSGDAGDALKPHNGEDFYTKDKPGKSEGSGMHKGGWWLDVYPSTNLNGLNLKEEIHITDGYRRRDGDALKPHNGEDFYTKDKRGKFVTSGIHKGGWWLDMYPSTNLNGLNLKEYRDLIGDSRRKDGITWFTFARNYLSLFFTEIKIRSREFRNSNG